MRPVHHKNKFKKFKNINYHHFLNLDVDIPDVKKDWRLQEQCEKNLDLLKVYNPKFKVLLSKRAHLEYEFKSKLVN